MAGCHLGTTRTIWLILFCCGRNCQKKVFRYRKLEKLPEILEKSGKTNSVIFYGILFDLSQYELGKTSILYK